MTNYNDALVLYNSGVVYGGVVAATWQIDIHGAVGAIGTAIQSNAEFKDASIVWTLDGPGSAEITLVEDDPGGQWLSGRRRVVISRNSTRFFAGYLNNVRASSAGRPHYTQYDVSVLGLASILDYRVVHGDFSNVSTVGTTIAWNLVNHANTQESMGFAQGSTTGTASSLTRHFCDGDVIGEMIKEVSERDVGGFDWEIDANGNFNSWVGGRGTDKSGSITFPFDKRISWTEESETSDVVTYTTALGKDPDGPCGPPLSVQNLALTDYPRREVVIEGERYDITELADAAIDEIKSRQRARVRVEMTMHVDDLPWAVGTSGVWLGDLISMDNNAPFGGTQTMKCIEVKVSLERGASEWWTYTFESTGTGTASLAGGPKLWLEADSLASLSDGTAVATWTDQSGNAHDVTQGTGANQPTKQTVNGRPVVRFDGSNDSMAGTGLMSNPTAFTVMICANTNSATSVGRYFFLSGGYHFYSEGTWPNATWSYYPVAGSSTAPTTVKDNVVNVATYRFTSLGANGLKFYVGGTLRRTEDADPTGGGDGSFRVGASSAGGEWVSMDCRAILVWDHPLTDNERKQWEKYLANKYKFTVAG